jgi:hypothetical protein
MHWLLLDTETSGIHPPIFALELAAQRMCDWEPDGPPFRRMLNHNQDIAPEASRVNGFTREILERDLADPKRMLTESIFVSLFTAKEFDDNARIRFKKLSLHPLDHHLHILVAEDILPGHGQVFAQR